MSSSLPPLRTGLPREVLQWLQDLELSPRPKNVRRDFSNGYLVADIFSHFYPKVFLLYSYKNGASLSIKQDNWTRIQKFLQKLDIYLSQDLINGTIHFEMGAAEKLLIEIYSILTNQSPDFESSLNTIQPELNAKSDRKEEILHREKKDTHITELSPSSGEAAVLYKEIKVHQPIRRNIQK